MRRVGTRDPHRRCATLLEGMHSLVEDSVLRDRDHCHVAFAAETSNQHLQCPCRHVENPIRSVFGFQGEREMKVVLGRQGLPTASGSNHKHRKGCLSQCLNALPLAEFGHVVEVDQQHDHLLPPVAQRTLQVPHEVLLDPER